MKTDAMIDGILRYAHSAAGTRDASVTVAQNASTFQFSAGLSPHGIGGKSDATVEGAIRSLYDQITANMGTGATMACALFALISCGGDRAYECNKPPGSSVWLDACKDQCVNAGKPLKTFERGLGSVKCECGAP